MRPLHPPPGRRPAPWALWRRSLPAVLVLVGLLVMLAAIGTRSEVPLYGRVIAALLGALVLLLLAAVVWALATGGNRRPLVRIDADGIALWCTQGRAEVPWSAVVAVGVGWKRAPRLPGAVRQGYAVEVFVDGPGPDPAAGALLVDEAPPRPDLPRTRLRLVLAGGDPTDWLAEAAAPYAGGRWLGGYQRDWLPFSTA